MAKQPDTTREWLEYYERLRDRAEANYQSCGEYRYYNSAYKYSVICDALEAKLEKETAREEQLNRAKKNFEHAVNNLLKTDYTRDEVIGLLRNAIFW